MACILAATFGNTRTANVANAQQVKPEEISYYNAPNDDGVTINFREGEDQLEYDGYQQFMVFFNLYYTDSICQGFQVINDPYNLFDSLFYFPNGQLGAYVNFPSNGPAETYVSFGKNCKEMAKLYIFKNGNYACASGASFNDARAKYYMWRVATNSEKSYYPQYWGNNFTLNSNASVNAIKHYGDYVYGTGTSDIITTRTTTSRSGWNDYGSNLSIKVHVEWYNNGQAYPVESARVKLFSKGSQITSGVCRTNANGDYTISMSVANTFNKTLGDLQLGIFTDTAASIIRDNYGFEYPYFHVASSSTNLFNLKKIEYRIKIYPERSDRAAAYEIAQAELVTQKYAKYYSGATISNNKTLFPAQRTTYLLNDYTYGTQNVSLKKAHYNCWDVIQHEYSHYICDKLDLCCNPEEGFTHRYNEDLTSRFGYDNGVMYAYSEGLATYLAIASQMDYAERVNSNSYCASIADCLYTDPANYISINYSAYHYGSTWGEYGEGVEASVTSALFKIHFFLDEIDHTAMWKAILASASKTNDVFYLMIKLANHKSSCISSFIQLLEQEEIYHPSLYTLSNTNKRRWTIMVYACGSTLEGVGGGSISDALSNIINSTGTSNDVNIIIETGGSSGWGTIHGKNASVIPNANMLSRFYVDDGSPSVEPNRPYYFERHASMGSEACFESFLKWGLRYYPAEKAGVILMNHGGAMKGVCFDEIYDPDSLANSETNRAFKNVLGENVPEDEKLEFISYEACLMCVQDIASFNSKFFKYMVASEIEVDAAMVSGINSEWVGLLFDSANDTVDILKKMVLEYSKNGLATWEQSLTILNLSKMPAYHTDFEDLITEICKTISNRDMTDWLGGIAEGINMPHNQYSGSVSGYHIADAYRFFNRLDEELEGLIGSQYTNQHPLRKKIIKLLSYFPSEYNIIPNTARNLCIAENPDGLVMYFGRGANNPATYGFTIHYAYTYYDDDGHECPFSPEETDFNVWYNLFA